MKRTRSEEEFIEQLSELLLAEGITALGVGDMAARLSCSRRRLYELAPTKRELLHLVAQRYFDAGRRAGEEAVERETDPARRIVVFLHAGIAVATKLSNAFLGDLEATPEGQEIFTRYQMERARFGQSVFEEGIRLGHYNSHNAAVALEVVLGAAMRLRKVEFLKRTGLSLQQAMEEAYALILNGLLARPAHHGQQRSKQR